MTIEEVKELRKSETAKLDTLEKIVSLLEQLEADVDSEAVDWIMEKLNE